MVDTVMPATTPHVGGTMTYAFQGSSPVATPPMELVMAGHGRSMITHPHVAMSAAAVAIACLIAAVVIWGPHQQQAPQFVQIAPPATAPTVIYGAQPPQFVQVAPPSGNHGVNFWDLHN